MDNSSDPIRTVKQRGKWYFDWHVLLAFFFIGTGIGIPLGVAMLCWRAWNEYKGHNWERKVEQGDFSTKSAWEMK